MSHNNYFAAGNSKFIHVLYTQKLYRIYYNTIRKWINIFFNTIETSIRSIEQLIFFVFFFVFFRCVIFNMTACFKSIVFKHCFSVSFFFWKRNKRKKIKTMSQLDFSFSWFWSRVYKLISFSFFFSFWIVLFYFLFFVFVLFLFRLLVIAFRYCLHYLFIYLLIVSF